MKCLLTDVARCPDGLPASKCKNCARKMDKQLTWLDVFLISVIAICLASIIILNLIWN